jgi:hypothetical protein
MQFPRLNKSKKAAALGLASVLLAVSIYLLPDRRPGSPPLPVPPAAKRIVTAQEVPGVRDKRARLVEARVSTGEPPARPGSSSAADEVTLSWLREILQALASPDRIARDNALNYLLPALVQKDASAAGVLAEANTAVETREDVMRRVAQLWAAQDSAGALAWAAALSKAEERDATIADVCFQVARSDPAEAVRLRERNLAPGHDERPDSALVNLTQQWAEKDWTAAMQWAVARADNEERNELIGRLAFVQSETSPANAARLIMERISPGQSQSDALRSVLHRWAAREPRAAADWVDQLPRGPLHDNAAQELAGNAQPPAS